MRQLIEGLESRAYFAVTAVVKSGVLTITGSEKADVISIGSISSKQIALGAFCGADGKTTNKTFKTASIRKIVVNARGGIDQVYCSAMSTAKPLSIDGGAGDDLIHGSTGGRDTLIGGAGKDTILGGSRGTTFLAKGDNGRDSITGYKGDKVTADRTDKVNLL